ncbi:hypothetical protein KIN20_024094 [Parelaphostrongylus tenuis]|uniref:Uncharacterized protein n=1 Tax=Parelaphostrongylus tenuis TaxID=148309 RepID=A0AAD5N7U6_PARTN|nr:hypothetical protein KIN20_024094 [Parelaphostrongylus tenuis]
MGDRLMRSIEDSVMASGVIVADVNAEERHYFLTRACDESKENGGCGAFSRKEKNKNKKNCNKHGSTARSQALDDGSFSNPKIKSSSSRSVDRADLGLSINSSFPALNSRNRSRTVDSPTVMKPLALNDESSTRYGMCRRESGTRTTHGAF